MRPQRVVLNCPSCGSEVPSALQYSKLAVCGACRTTLFLEDQVVKHAGVKSVLSEEPSLLSLGRRFRYKTWLFEPLGRLRFDYGDGFWDEWWVLLDTGAGRWFSIDEGDIAIEVPLELTGEAPDLDAMQVGQEVSLEGMRLRVTEKQTATCVGMEGELPEVSFPGDVHDYVHLSGPRGTIVTGEHFEGTTEFYTGAWVDPFMVEAV